jgi:hypothetical protein
MSREERAAPLSPALLEAMSRIGPVRTRRRGQAFALLAIGGTAYAALWAALLGAWRRSGGGGADRRGDRCAT